jgi:ABC-type transport system involved in multi-copper enzyme maturation permease subunit
VSGGRRTLDAPTATKPVRINRWLPYWAVFQNDVRQTLASWVYRTWVLVSVLAGGGYLLYRWGVKEETGVIQSASLLVSDLLRWTVLGSVTLIILLTVGSICSERGSMADSVLSRGISRYQYFLGKLHARLVTVLGTYLLMGAAALVAAFFLLHEDLDWRGSLVALLNVGALLATVVTCGVAVSAIVNSTLLGSAVLWILVYGTGFALSLHRSLNTLPHMLRGFYDITSQAHVVGWSALVSAVAALVGMVYFARRDV